MAKIQPMHNMIANMQEVDRLTAIHETLTGTARGRRHRVEVLNKSAIVLITACWEAFVEDSATQAFDFLLTHAKTPDRFPIKIRVLASRELKNSTDERMVWNLAGAGWKKVLKDYRNEILKRFVVSLNTPRPANIDKMFNDLLDVGPVSSSWRWRKLKAPQARKTLDDFITLRGDIAHRVSTATSVPKARVQQYRDFTFRIAVKTSNYLNMELEKIVKKGPWGHWSFGAVS
jgi:hypothetical protein